jgi:hypothetical protein
MAGYKNFPAVMWDGVVDPNPAVSAGVDVSTGYPLGGNYTGNYKVCSTANGCDPASHQLSVRELPESGPESVWPVHADRRAFAFYPNASDWKRVGRTSAPSPCLR